MQQFTGTKRCSKCKEVKDLEHFHKASTPWGKGRVSWCKVCVNGFKPVRVPPTTKECGACKLVLPAACYNSAPRMTSGLSSYCKLCFASFRKERQARPLEPDLEALRPCTKCRQKKPGRDFNRCRKNSDGLNEQCKACLQEYRQKPEVKKRTATYDSTPERKAYYANYRVTLGKQPKQKQRKKESTHRYKQSPKGKALQCKLNKGLPHIIRKRFNNALRNFLDAGGTKPGSAVKDLGCTVAEAVSYIEALWETGMSWNNHGDGPGKWQIDHIRPLASFDLTKRDQFVVAAHFLNLQPLWFDDHNKKSVLDRAAIAAARQSR